MSQIVKTEAVVLKSIKYRETSKIVTFYTRRFGKIAAIVKGAREAKNKYGSSLQPMSYVFLVLYKKGGRDIQLVAQCDLIISFSHLADNLEKMSVGMSMIELVDMVAHEEEENSPLFSLLVDSLTTLNSADRHMTNLFFSFQIRLASILGFQPKFSACISCGRAVPLEGDQNKVAYLLSTGAPLCFRCVPLHGHTVTLSMRALRILVRISESTALSDVLGIEIEKKLRGEIESMLWTYLRHQVSAMKPSKTGRVFSKLLVES